MRKFFQTRLKRHTLDFLVNEDGQAIVEYILTVFLAVVFVGILASGFRASILKLWELIAKEVSSACIGCPADPKIKLR